MILTMMMQAPTAIGHPILGYILPALIFLISFWVAIGLFIKFNKKIKS
ncbi:hypothetical protein JXO59_16535 [candidate division KSB1 bacterium]|nr:hypothetical protein [candidate division KSB1 bacterium]